MDILKFLQTEPKIFFYEEDEKCSFDSGNDYIKLAFFMRHYFLRFIEIFRDNNVVYPIELQYEHDHIIIKLNDKKIDETAIFCRIEKYLKHIGKLLARTKQEEETRRIYYDRNLFFLPHSTEIYNAMTFAFKFFLDDKSPIMDASVPKDCILLR